MMPFGSKFVDDFKRAAICKIAPNFSVERETMKDKNHQSTQKT